MLVVMPSLPRHPVIFRDDAPDIKITGYFYDWVHRSHYDIFQLWRNCGQPASKGAERVRRGDKARGPRARGLIWSKWLGFLMTAASAEVALCGALGLQGTVYSVLEAPEGGASVVCAAGVAPGAQQCHRWTRGAPRVTGSGSGILSSLSLTEGAPALPVMGSPLFRVVAGCRP